MKKRKITLWSILSLILLFGISASVWGAGPGKVRITSQRSDATARRYTLNWNKVSDVDGYEIRLQTMDRKELLRKTLKGKSITSYTLSGVKPGSFYRLYIRAYRTTVNPRTGIRKKVYGDAAGTYIAQQPKIKYAWVSKKEIRARWKTIEGATGYDVYISTRRGSGYKKAASVKSGEAVLKKLKMNQTYYVYVVAKRKTKTATYRTPVSYSYPFRLQMN